ncbi:protein-disulfide reductase DsbD N-terminal domain-containing protein [Terriglobus roseus]|uniref:Disulphide bond corrector protein DsbC n=1 Tax=Terriglobus roseus TaxID=392734 RepID=A0A1H4JY94_9BACT|nr:protein-disulfide reductase DsbD N-terminal domain-containing protein [Terriglobus roseus]SEB51261.1 Disulphide bond corrector protein DsbC [Terriglobus roseus]
MSKIVSAITASLLFCSAAAMSGQRPSEIVKWDASVAHSSAYSASVALHATIQDGWHVYALSQPPGGPTPLKISIPAGAPYALQSPVAEGKVTKHEDANFKMETLYYLNAVSFTLAVKKDGAATPETIPVDVRFQACSDRLCLPPYTAHLTAESKRK